MHNNVIIGLAVITAFTLSIVLALYGMRLLDRDRQWRPRRYGVSAREVSCSFCGKLVRAEAILCRHCHHRLDEVVEDRTEEEEIADSVGALQRSDKQLAPAVAATAEIVEEDFSKNQAFAWLDSAFAQLTVKEAPAVWGATLATGTEPLQQETAGKNEMVVRTIGPLSQQPGLTARRTQNWLRGWKPRKELAFAAAIASVALIVGGSTFLVGPSKSRVTKVDDYVTFDVSDHAPLYTGPEGKAEASISTKAAEPAQAVEPVAAAKVESAAVAKPESATIPKMDPAPAPSTPPVIALPELLPVASPENAATTTPVNLAAIAPPQSAAKSEPVAAVPPREEDWASLVSRAVRPAQSKDLVVAVQRLIRAEGYDPGTIDGTVGPRTRRAIQMYQRNGGLPPTGEIDRDLLTKLNLADRTVRVIGPLSGVAPLPIQPISTKPASTKPAVEWTK